MKNPPTVGACERDYQELKQEVAALTEAEAINRDVNRLNNDSPDAIKIDQLVTDVDLAAWENLVLPAPGGEGFLWPAPSPQHQPSVVESVAPMGGGDPMLYSADWHAAREARMEAVKREQARIAPWHAEQSRLQTERLNREEHERLGFVRR